MRILHSDVTLIGAGPAGCFLSVLLARSGVQVTLLEQHPTFDREFRGNAFQPLVLKTLEQMGLGSLLDELDHQTVDLFEVREQGLPLLSLPIRDLPPPWNFAVITPQAPLLKRLVEEAGRYSNFRFLSGAPVHGVVLENGKVAGVMAQFQDQRWLIESRLVVAADGRFSTVRRDLGIGYSKNPQEFDFLWFDMPRVTARQDHLGLTLEEAGILVNLPKGGGVSQVGWVIPKGSFAKLRQEGMQRFYERVRSVDRDLGDALPQHLQNFDQCSLLDVKIGVADTWARDGMVLIGDAAHTASPIGAQGNKLAIEDAVLVHPLIVRALREGERPVPASCFREFTTARRAEVERLLGLQKIFGRLLLEVKRGPWLALRRKVMRWLDGSSFKKRLVARMALGPHAVDTACFDNVRNEDPAQVFHRVRIKNIVQETARARTLVLDIPAALKSLFAYRPGQFLTVRVLRKGVLAKRCYSLSSTPGVDPDPQITIKWILNGRVSTWLTKEVKAGDALWVLPPAGSFVHRPDASRPRRHVMFAAGS
ncbi:MAG: FAD-dependent monooxygenase, partial [Nitrospinaceae bacterium]